MTSPRPEAASGPLLRLAAALLVTGFVVAFAARPPLVLSTAGADDALFMRLGMHLAAGDWLGRYNELTLVKGPGFPAFLALANLLGLPFSLALALFHAACASFAAVVFARLGGSRWLGLALLAALLLTPTLYDGELMRVFRDVFYASLCVALVAAAAALASGCLGRPRGVAVLTGGLGGWAWLTREEGVWLLPCLVVFLLIPLLRLRHETALPAGDARAVLRRLAPAGLAWATAATLVVGVGLINWAAYGRFEVNEIKDRHFQAALSALQDASAPFHREGVPVPAAARARIYAASPAFASLKQPILDGPLQAEATQWGCQQNPRYCGDFAGGWFVWNLRQSAALQGWHASPAKAAASYDQLAREVRQACADGRLACGRWRVPLVPPMRAGELADVAASLGKLFDVFTFGRPVATAPRRSDLGAPDAAAMLGFLDAPGVQVPTNRRQLRGWFVDRDAGWFVATPGPGVSNLDVRRLRSRDLVAHFKDPRLQAHRFLITAQCGEAGACPTTLAFADGARLTLDLAAPAPGARQVAGGVLNVEGAGPPKPPPLLKNRFSQAWLAAEARLPGLYRGLVALGAAAWLFLLGRAVARRQASAGLVVCTGLLAAVAARMVLLALIDALSFAAASPAYCLPGILLLTAFSVLAVGEAVGVMRAARPRAIIDGRKAISLSLTAPREITLLGGSGGGRRGTGMSALSQQGLRALAGAPSARTRWIAAAVVALAVFGAWTSYQYARVGWGADADIYVTVALWRGVKAHGLAFLSSWSYTQDNWLFSLIPISSALYQAFGPHLALAVGLGWGFFVAAVALTAWLVWVLAGRRWAVATGVVLLFAGYPALTVAGYLSYPISHTISMVWGLAAIAVAVIALQRRAPALALLAALLVLADALSDPWAGAGVAVPMLLAAAGVAVARREARLTAAVLALACAAAFVAARTRLFGALSFLPASHLELTDLAGALANLRWGFRAAASLFDIVPGGDLELMAVRVVNVLAMLVVLGGAALAAVAGLRRASLERQFVTGTALLSLAFVGAAYLLGRWDHAVGVGRFFPNLYFLGALLAAIQAASGWATWPRWRRLAIAVYAALFMLAGLASRPAAWLGREDQPSTAATVALGDFISAHGLRVGYGPFWGTEALAMPYLTDGRVVIRPVAFEPQGIRRRPAETSSYWYRPAAEPRDRPVYLVVMNDGEQCPDPAACVRLAVRQFGPPATTLSYGGASILVWNHPLADRIRP
jgi:hypothetical protein